MKNIILCDVTASVSELKNDPVAAASAGGGYPVAIIDRNRLVFFIVCPRLCMNKCSMRWTKKTWYN
ncbi:RelB/StbD [Klebsiella variicola]|nr:RelB/StbD [Klebsiella variicola]